MFHQHFSPYWGDGGHGAHFLALGVMIALWVGVVFIGLALLRSRRHASHARHPGPLDNVPPTSDAIDILKKRFAKGDITEEDFTRRLHVLKNC
jgi:uncharacterized membrane protein